MYFMFLLNVRNEWLSYYNNFIYILTYKVCHNYYLAARIFYESQNSISNDTALYAFACYLTQFNSFGYSIVSQYELVLILMSYIYIVS